MTTDFGVFDYPAIEGEYKNTGNIGSNGKLLPKSERTGYQLQSLYVEKYQNRISVSLDNLLNGFTETDLYDPYRHFDSKIGYIFSSTEKILRLGRSVGDKIDFYEILNDENILMKLDFMRQNLDSHNVFIENIDKAYKKLFRTYKGTRPKYED